MIVCHCKRVTDRELLQCNSLKEAREKTGASTCCGGCLEAVKEIVYKGSSMNKNDVAVVLCEDFVGLNPIKEYLIRDGKVITKNSKSSIPELLNSGANLISVTTADSGATLFYFSWV